MNSRRGTRSTFLLTVSVGIIACAGHTPPDVSPDPSEGRVIGMEEIARLGGSNAWEVLQRAGTHLAMRDDGYGNPARLTYRGSASIELSNAPLLYLDGVRISDFKRLRDIVASTIETIQILNGTQATKYYGTGGGNGVIAIITRA